MHLSDVPRTPQKPKTLLGKAILLYNYRFGREKTIDMLLKLSYQQGLMSGKPLNFVKAVSYLLKGEITQFVAVMDTESLVMTGLYYVSVKPVLNAVGMIRPFPSKNIIVVALPDKFSNLGRGTTWEQYRHSYLFYDMDGEPEFIFLC